MGSNLSHGRSINNLTTFSLSKKIKKDKKTAKSKQKKDNVITEIQLANNSMPSTIDVIYRGEREDATPPILKFRPDFNPNRFSCDVIGDRAHGKKQEKSNTTRQQQTDTANEHNQLQSSPTTATTEQNQLQSSTTTTEQNQLQRSITATGQNQLQSSTTTTTTGQNQLQSSTTTTGQNQLQSSNTTTGQNQLQSSNTTTGQNQLQSSNTTTTVDVTTEKCYDPTESTLTFVDGDDDMDFLCMDYKSLRARMSCGHSVTPMSLTDWCQRQLDEGSMTFKCGQTDCKAEWAYEEVCKMALLTPQERKHFDNKLFTNAAKNKLNVKSCPGCKCLVVRPDVNNLCVKCPKCTANNKKPYKFCWQCLKEWRGPVPAPDLCENDYCGNVQLEILKNCSDLEFQDVKGVVGCPSIRACPTCGKLLEHSTNKCKIIYCTRCKKKFCFVCLKLYPECLSYYELCSSGVASRQTTVPVWTENCVKKENSFTNERSWTLNLPPLI